MFGNLHDIVSAVTGWQSIEGAKGKKCTVTKKDRKQRSDDPPMGGKGVP